MTYDNILLNTKIFSNTFVLNNDDWNYYCLPIVFSLYLCSVSLSNYVDFSITRVCKSVRLNKTVCSSLILSILELSYRFHMYDLESIGTNSILVTRKYVRPFKTLISRTTRYNIFSETLNIQVLKCKKFNFRTALSAFIDVVILVLSKS